MQWHCSRLIRLIQANRLATKYVVHIRRNNENRNANTPIKLFIVEQKSRSRSNTAGSEALQLGSSPPTVQPTFAPTSNVRACGVRISQCFCLFLLFTKNKKLIMRRSPLSMWIAKELGGRCWVKNYHLCGREKKIDFFCFSLLIKGEIREM